MKKKLCVLPHFGAFQDVLVHFGGVSVSFPFCCTTCFSFAVPTHTPKRYMKLNFTKNININTIKSCLKFKIVYCLNLKPLFTR